MRITWLELRKPIIISNTCHKKNHKQFSMFGYFGNSLETSLKFRVPTLVSCGTFIIHIQGILNMFSCCLWHLKSVQSNAQLQFSKLIYFEITVADFKSIIHSIFLSRRVEDCHTSFDYQKKVVAINIFSRRKFFRRYPRRRPEGVTGERRLKDVLDIKRVRTICIRLLSLCRSSSHCTLNNTMRSYTVSTYLNTFSTS